MYLLYLFQLKYTVLQDKLFPRIYKKSIWSVCNVDQELQWTEQETTTPILSCSVSPLIKIALSSFFQCI